MSQLNFRFAKSSSPLPGASGGGSVGSGRDSGDGEFDFIGGGLASLPYKTSKTVMYVGDVESVCRGLIGTSGTKFCMRVGCVVRGHKSNKFEGMEPGLYVKHNDNEAYLSPMVPKSSVSDSVIETFLQRSWSDSREVVRYFDHVTSIQDDPKQVITNFTELDLREAEVKAALATKTPARKRRNQDHEDNLDLLQRFLSEEMPTEEDLVKEELSDKFDEGYDGTSLKMKKMKQGLELLANSMDEEKRLIETTLEKVDDLSSSIGRFSSSCDLPPTLWLAIEHVQEEIAKAKETFQRSVVNDEQYVKQNKLDIVERRLDQELSCLQSNTEHNFSVTEETFSHLRGLLYSPDISFPNIAVISKGMDTINLQMGKVQTDISNLIRQQQDGNAKSLNQQVVSIGNFTFRSTEDIRAWGERYLPDTFPFEAFVDCFTVFERIRSFKDDSSTDLKDMEIRKKLQLSSAGQLSVDSFKNPLPKVWRGSGSENSSAGTWLPGIPTKNKWEDESGMTGAKVVIAQDLENVRERCDTIIRERLPNHTEARALATELLSQTITFVTSLCKYVSETQLRLELSGFKTDAAWTLVSKLVHRIFAVDCHMKRSRVLEFLDASDTKVMGSGVLWGVFATHAVMRDYMKYGIENHPSIASEYVRFLVANSGLVKLDKIDTQQKEITSRLTEVEKKLAQLEKAQTTSANKLSELAKKVK